MVTGFLKQNVLYRSLAPSCLQGNYTEPLISLSPESPPWGYLDIPSETDGFYTGDSYVNTTQIKAPSRQLGVKRSISTAVQRRERAALVFIAGLALGY